MAKIELGDFVEYGRLFETYGKLLSVERQKVMNMYFNYNMTLAEIAQELNVSRQAVLDTISKSRAKLDEFEQKLGIVSKKKELTGKIDALKTKTASKELKVEIDKILKILN